MPRIGTLVITIITLMTSNAELRDATNMQSINAEQIEARALKEKGKNG
jgi:hypothetical protein